MKKLLFIDTAVRENESRTKMLCDYALEELGREYDVHTLFVPGEGLCPLTAYELERRTELCNRGDYSDEIFKYAKMFRDADYILICAPYWDLSFPSWLKVFFERVSVCGLTFGYSESGELLGFCRAQHLMYVTTSGGYIGERNFGYEYVKALTEMLGVKSSECVSCEGLDIDGADVESALAAAKSDIDMRLEK